MADATPKTYVCEAGIKPTADKTGTVLWVKSPKTGATLDLFLSPYWINLLPPRFVSRVTHANANGRQTVDFTADELKTFKRVIDSIEEARRHHTNIPASGNRRGGF